MSNSIFHFTKMHGLGNDFVVVDNMNLSYDYKQFDIPTLADRHLGIGFDQLLLIEPSAIADFSCRIINSDGSLAEQCGNGLRCVARFVHEKKLSSKKLLAIETIAGIFPAEIKDYDHIRITIPTDSIDTKHMELALSSPNIAVNGAAISIGNPHFIVTVPNIDTTKVSLLGQAISAHSSFPEGTNVGFMQIINSGHIRLRTFERGAGATHACGSNACAAVATGILDGSLQKAVTVEFSYGQLMIEWEGKGRPVHMTGPAALVFDGQMALSK